MTRQRRRTTEHEVAVRAPFRLDLTVTALRRMSTNIVDLFSPDGEYMRALPGARGTVIARVRQTRADALVARFEGGGEQDHVRALATISRMLGVTRDVSGFGRAARTLPWLHDLVVRMRGVKPPRYPTLWEACVNAVLFQQVSLAAASSISRRLTMTIGDRAYAGTTSLHLFPTAERLRETKDEVLRATGSSASKLATLRRIAEALHTRELDEATLETLPSPQAAAKLLAIKGIGPWTATVILLRGLGRLDVFPMNDSSVTQNLGLVAGPTRLQIDDVLATLGPLRGMLYYHLLLARLEARGDIGRPSTAFTSG